MADVEDVDEQGNKPTPETIRKLQPDPFRLLYLMGGQGKRRGLDGHPSMNSLMFDAGIEIRRAFTLLSAPVAMKIHDYEREVRRTPWEAAETQTVGVMQNARICRRYCEWVERMAKRHLPIGPVLDVVVDGIGCQAADRARRKGTGYTGRVLREGLKLYCEVAGWTRRAA